MHLGLKIIEVTKGRIALFAPLEEDPVMASYIINDLGNRYLHNTKKCLTSTLRNIYNKYYKNILVDIFNSRQIFFIISYGKQTTA